MLLAVGVVNIHYIARHKRLRSDYRVEDYALVIKLIDRPPAVATTAYALTEASNLLRQCGDPMRSEIMAGLAGIIGLVDELTPAASGVCTTPEFIRLGLTDAGLCHLDPDLYEVLSADRDLVIALQARGFQVVNFHDLRSG